MRDGLETTMADEIRDPPGKAGDTKDPSSNGTAERTYTKAEHTATIAREVAKERAQREAIARERDELAAKVAEADKAREEAETAKLSATEREKRQRESETNALKATVEAAKAEAAKERNARHGLAVSHAASRKVAAVAVSLSHPGLAVDYEREITRFLVVQPNAAGVEEVMWQHGPGDVVPFDEGFKQHEATGAFARFQRVAGGSGGQHGAGAGSGGPMPTTLVDAMLQSARRRAGR